MPKVHIDSLVGLEGQLALRTVETLSRDFLHPLTFDEWRGSIQLNVPCHNAGLW